MQELSEEELLNDWLIKLYANLKETNDEIEELENKMILRKKLNALHLNRLEKWIIDKDADEEVREELKYSKEVVRKMPSDFEKELAYLKKSKKTTLFMINKIEKELRD